MEGDDRGKVIKKGGSDGVWEKMTREGGGGVEEWKGLEISGGKSNGREGEKGDEEGRWRWRWEPWEVDGVLVNNA